MNSQRFFKFLADGWNYLVRQKKKQTIREEVIHEARRAYYRGIEKAWDKYTENTETVKKARKDLNKAIHKAYKFYLTDEEEMSEETHKSATELYVDAVHKAHDECAKAVKHIWIAFMKDMKNS